MHESNNNQHSLSVDVIIPSAVSAKHKLRSILHSSKRRRHRGLQLYSTTLSQTATFTCHTHHNSKCFLCICRDVHQTRLKNLKKMTSKQDDSNSRTQFRYLCRDKRHTEQKQFAPPVQYYCTIITFRTAVNTFGVTLLHSSNTPPKRIL